MSVTHEIDTEMAHNANRDGDTPEALIRCADAAMYRAKRQGRNRYCVCWSETAKGNTPDSRVL